MINITVKSGQKCFRTNTLSAQVRLDCPTVPEANARALDDYPGGNSQQNRMNFGWLVVFGLTAL